MHHADYRQHNALKTTLRDDFKNNTNKKRPSSVPTGKVSGLGSCTGMVRTQAGCFAFSHPHKLTGYKDPNSETNLRIIGAETSYKHFHETNSGLPSHLKAATGNSRYQPKLQTYHPDAKCNRNALVFANEPIPCVRFCALRNVHRDSDRPAYERQYRTHNGMFYPAWDNLPTGFENSGVMSDFASKVHFSQLR